MSASSAAQAGREARARLGLWPSTCKRYRKTGANVRNGKAQVPEWANEANITVRIGGQERSTTVGPNGAKQERGSRTASLPIGTDLRDGDFLLLTAGENAGDVWRVVDVSRADQRTALRVTVVADREQEGWS